jgi:hypothetical protein
MIFLLFLASAVHASTYNRLQIPLKDTTSDIVVPLTVSLRLSRPVTSHYLHAHQLDANLHYTFPAYPSNSTLEALQHTTDYPSIYAHDTVTITIPLDRSAAASVTFSHDTRTDDASPLIWLPTTRAIELDHIGIRKGGMVSAPAWSTWLALETPYILLPTDVFAVLLQATKTTAVRGYMVDCGIVGILPDIVFGLDTEDGDEAQELVVRPEQYVMEIEEGLCVLLARGSGGSMERLGWAAVRGRALVLDRSRGMMAFEI